MSPSIVPQRSFRSTTAFRRSQGRSVRRHSLLTVPAAARQHYLSMIDSFATLERAEIQELGIVQSPDTGPLPLHAIRIAAEPQVLRPVRVLLSAGMHGDEPAGIFALLRFLESHAFALGRIQFLIFPCINPVGFLMARRQSSNHHDLNRVVHPRSLAPEMRMIVRTLEAEAQGFDACFDLHEDSCSSDCDFAPQDPVPQAFYLYESEGSATLGVGEQVVDDLRAHRFAICNWSHIYGEPAQDGRICPNPAHARSKLLHFEKYLSQSHSPVVITSETPTVWSLTQRIRAHCIVLAAGISAVEAQARE
jgi:protein MpaA